jgi:hypothetical protein
MTISELREEIEKQKESNINLYKTIPTASHEDPRNEKADPILKQWRAGSKRLKELLNKLYEMEKEVRESPLNETTKTFVNSFGEATKREIASDTYKRAENRMSKEIMSFVGIR